MATGDKEQQSQMVPQHKRLAQGVDVTKSGDKQVKKGGLEQAKKK